MKLTRIARRQNTYAIAGRRSKGKTLLAVGMVKELADAGSLIFSNIDLKFPHYRIFSLDDIEHIYQFDKRIPKVFLCDDVERYLHARAYSSKLNQALNDILLDFGKASCSMVMTMKQGPLNEGKSLDVGLRDAVDVWYYPDMHRIVYHDDPEVDDWLDEYMDFYEMNILCIDGYLLELWEEIVETDSLLRYAQLYDTFEQVLPLTGLDERSNPSRNAPSGGQGVSLGLQGRAPA